MSDVVQPNAADEDVSMAALFAQRLPNEPLVPAVVDRLTTLVLDEVRNQAVLQDPPLPARRSGSHGAHFLLSAVEQVRSWMERLTPKQSLLLAGAGALAAMLLFVGISRVTPRPLSTVAAVSGGDATVLSAHNDSFRIRQDGDLLKLRQGDRVLTGEGSVALEHFADHVTVIEPGADVELTQLDEAEGGQQLVLTVHDGLVHSTIGQPLQATDRYIIQTPGITVTAVGTDFSVETISEEETLVSVFSGTVLVTMNAETLRVGPGQEVDAVAGQPLEVQPADGRYDGGQTPMLLTVADDVGTQLYAQPRLDSAPVGRLSAGQAVLIKAQDPTGRWLQVCCIAKQSGWVKVK